MSQQSSIFSFNGDDFVRQYTTLLTEAGTSAVGTLLDRDNPGYEALLQKQSYVGPVTLFGHRYEARYAPLLDAGGQLEGALMVCVSA